MDEHVPTIIRIRDQAVRAVEPPTTAPRLSTRRRLRGWEDLSAWERLRVRLEFPEYAFGRSRNPGHTFLDGREIQDAMTL